jgi:hypothetical protein
MAAIVNRAFIFTPAFLQENDGNPEFLQEIFPLERRFCYGTLKVMSVSKAVRLAIVLTRRINELPIRV